MIDAVIECAARLRLAGVDVSMSATVDASEALRHVDMSRRDQVRVALAATLVKQASDLAVFATVFDRCFPARSAPAAIDAIADGTEADRLAGALAGGAELELEDLARRLVARYAGVGSSAGRTSERYHLQRVERALDLSGAFQTALRARRPDGERRSDLEEQLARGEISALLERFRRELRREVQRQRLADEAASGGAEALDTVTDTDFLGASTTELRAMQAAVRPLARRLAARLASRDRRHRRGRVDIRRTMRRSLTSGGVPVELVQRHRRRSRPDLWLLCDVSGSVAEFARFMLAFVYVMHEEFPRIRTFVFVDDVEEITALLARRGHDLDPFALLARASAPHGRHRSDYGRALERFWTHYGDEVGPWATVILTGDARTHDRDPGAETLTAIAGRARRVWFLNPEPRAVWGTGDSAALQYGGICHHVAEVRNLRQLTACVAELA